MASFGLPDSLHLRYLLSVETFLDGSSEVRCDSLEDELRFLTNLRFTTLECHPEVTVEKIVSKGYYDTGRVCEV